MSSLLPKRCDWQKNKGGGVALDQGKAMILSKSGFFMILERKIIRNCFKNNSRSVPSRTAINFRVEDGLESF